MSKWEGKIDINKVFVLQPTRPVTYFGVGSIQKVNDILDGFTQKGLGNVLVVTDNIAYKASGAWDTVEPALNKYAKSWKHYDKVRPNPTYDNCEEAAAVGTKMKADYILAIGGGSSIDAAKTAAVLMRHPGKKAVDFYEKGEPITGAVPLVLINTTHGTGSECDAFAVAQADGHDKPAINSPHIYATYSIEDPALTVNMPLKQTVFTTVDAINHSLEAATTITTTPYSFALAREAIRLAATYLPKAIVEPSSLTARYWLMYASAISGMSFDLAFLHITHALEHAMSTLNPGVAHGDGLGILMPAMVKEIYHAVPEQLSEVLAPIVPDLKGVPAETDKAVEGIVRWFNSVGQKTDMSAYFTEADVPELVNLTMRSSLSKMLLPLAPIPVDEKVVERVFRNSL